MPVMSIVIFVGLLLLSVAVNPFHQQAWKEQHEQTSLEMMTKEKPQKLGMILFAVGLVVLTVFVTVLVYVPFE